MDSLGLRTSLEDGSEQARMASRLWRLLRPGFRRFVRRAIASPRRFSYWLASNGVLENENHRRIMALRNCHAGERCFIIGNGPSLNEMDLGPLGHEITFGFNAFFLAFEKVGFLPTYYLVEDPLPAEDNAEMLNALNGTTKIYPVDLRYCLEPAQDTVYVYFDRYYSDYPDDGFPRFSTDALKGLYWGGTVAYMAIQVAYHMGIREIYLVGMDLEYSLPHGAEGEVIISREADPNHFHPDYFGPGKRWHVPKVERMQRALVYANEFVSRQGGRVINASVGGKLKELPRVSFNEVIRHKGDASQSGATA